MQEQIEYLGRSNGENAVASRSTDANGSSIRRKIIFRGVKLERGGNGGKRRGRNERIYLVEKM